MGKQRMTRVSASAAQILFAVLALLAGLWMPAQAVADSGGAAADTAVSAATSLAQQMTASAEKTGGAALGTAEAVAQGAISQAKTTAAQAIQGAQQTANAALSQARSVAGAAVGSSSGTGSSGSSGSSSTGSGATPSQGGSTTSSSGSTGSIPASQPSAQLAALPAAIAGAVHPGAVPTGPATSVTREAAGQPAASEPVRVAAAGGEGRRLGHRDLSAGATSPRGSSSASPGKGHEPPLFGADLERRATSAPARGLLPALAHPGGGDITASRPASVHTSLARTVGHTASSPTQENSTYVAPPVLNWLGPAAGGATAGSGAGGGGAAAAGVLATASLALLIFLASGRLPLDLLPMRSKLAASPPERPG